MFRGHLFRQEFFNRAAREKKSDIPEPFLRMSGSHKFDRSLAHPVRVSVRLFPEPANVGHNKGSLDFKKRVPLDKRGRASMPDVDGLREALEAVAASISASASKKPGA